MTHQEEITIYYDPTSEPCRAIKWFLLETGLSTKNEIKIKLTWLGKQEHRTDELMKINPTHQLPLLVHAKANGDQFVLPESQAILLYIAELYNIKEEWFGKTIEERAIVNRYLSWYHTNIRLKVTLQYFLSCYISPFYRGTAVPSSEKITQMKKEIDDCLAHLDSFLQGKDFLLGNRLTCADISLAPELFALDIDPAIDEMVYNKFANIKRWACNLRSRPALQSTDKKWNAVIPFMRDHVLKNKGKAATKEDIKTMTEI